MTNQETVTSIYGWKERKERKEGHKKEVLSWSKIADVVWLFLCQTSWANVTGLPPILDPLTSNFRLRYLRLLITFIIMFLLIFLIFCFVFLFFPSYLFSFFPPSLPFFFFFSFIFLIFFVLFLLILVLFSFSPLPYYHFTINLQILLSKRNLGQSWWSTFSLPICWCPQRYYWNHTRSK